MMEFFLGIQFATFQTLVFETRKQTLEKEQIVSRSEWRPEGATGVSLRTRATSHLVSERVCALDSLAKLLAEFKLATRKGGRCQMASNLLIIRAPDLLYSSRNSQASFIAKRRSKEEEAEATLANVIVFASRV